MGHLSKNKPGDSLSSAEARILDAARDLFLSEGFSAVSTDRLSKEAGVSKSSIYKYFGDMAGVLSAVVLREGDMFSIGIDTDPTTAQDFWRALTGFGSNLMDLLNRDFCVQIDRMLHQEARKHPDLMRRYYDSAYGRGHREIAGLIAAGKTRGFITKPQSAEALADNLLCMWEGLGCVRSRLGLQSRPCENPRAWARQCVRTLFAEDVERARVSAPGRRIPGAKRRSSGRSPK